MNEIKLQGSKDSHLDQGVRPKRVPLGSRNRLTIPESMVDRKEAEPRWINDRDDRIKNALEAGYVFVESNEEAGDPRAAEASKIGKRVTKSVGGGTTAFLMKLKREFYDEDQKAKLKRIDDIELGMKPQKAKEEYGPGLTNE
jgi:hypothetical protein